LIYHHIVRGGFTMQNIIWDSIGAMAIERVRIRLGERGIRGCTPEEYMNEIITEVQCLKQAYYNLGADRVDDEP